MGGGYGGNDDTGVQLDGEQRRNRGKLLSREGDGDGAVRSRVLNVGVPLDSGEGGDDHDRVRLGGGGDEDYGVCSTGLFVGV